MVSRRFHVLIDWNGMATREHRIAEFNTGEPPTDQALEILCEDHCGTYVFPFRCRLINGTWIGTPKNLALEVTVIGWRPWADSSGFTGPQTANDY